MPGPRPPDGDVSPDVAAWASSGAMALSGPRHGDGLGPPAPLVGGLSAVAEILRRRSRSLGRQVAVDPLTVLTERAAIGRFTRNGTTSCGGASRLLATLDDRWVAVTLARPDDVDLVPAWLGIEVGPDPWVDVAAVVSGAVASAVVDRGAMLGLPVAALPDQPPAASVAPLPLAPLPCRARRVGDRRPTTQLDDLVVVDLSSLWAGPLASSLLAAAGAEVWKVESVRRPDGARRGSAWFFDLLNADKRSVAVDLGTASGREQLQRIVARADVVIEASRPRALAQLGIDAEEMLTDGSGRVWVSITGHGRTPPAGAPDRVGFGDDAAVAGGLVVWDGAQPCFCADAVADPATGLTAAAACLDALAAGGSWLLDVALADVAARLAGPTLPVPTGVTAAAPRARPHERSAPALGSDTGAVLARTGEPS